MNRRMMAKPTTRRDAVDAVRLKAAGHPSHINAREESLLRREMPQAAGPVITQGLLAEAGVKGDDRVTNLIPSEAKLLKRHGGSGDRNPITGLLQYGMSDGEGPSGHDSNPGGVGGGPAGGQTGGGIGGNTSDGQGGLSGGYGPGEGYAGSRNERAAQALGDYYQDTYVNGMLDTPWAEPDTFGRLYQTYRYGPPPSYTERGKVPGKYGAPTGLGPGIVGRAAAAFGGPMMSGLMNVGMHMDQAMSPESRAASLSANQAQGSKNSTGRDNSGFSDNAPGTASGSVTAAQQAVQQAAQQVADTTSAPGYAIGADGRISHAGRKPSGTLSGLPQPVQNLLIDYLWSRQDKGLLG